MTTYERAEAAMVAASRLHRAAGATRDALIRQRADNDLDRLLADGLITMQERAALRAKHREDAGSAADDEVYAPLYPLAV